MRCDIIVRDNNSQRGEVMPEYQVSAHIHRNKIEYGIILFAGGKAVKSAPDLSENETDVRALAEMLNELAVEPCHFEDVIEDYLTDFSV